MPSGASKKPPCGSEQERRKRAGQRCQFARQRRFVEREDDDPQAGRIADRIEQRRQPVDEIHRTRNVETLVAAEPLEHAAIEIARRAGMDLHHHAVRRAHPRHFGQHLRAEQRRIARAGLAGAHPFEQGPAFVGRQIGGLGRRHAMIGGNRAGCAEIGAALPVGIEIAIPASGIAAGHLGQRVEIGLEMARDRDRRPRRAGMS